MCEQLPTLSPLRYPGGKNWLRGTVLKWIRSLPERPSVFIEPFGGGASVSFAVAYSATVHRILISELDPDVAALWRAVFSDDCHKLTDRIESFLLLRADVQKLLATEADNAIDRAFRCLLRNRVQHGGVMAPGANLLKNGEANRGIASRWYPETLVERINKLHAMCPRVEFIEGDGIELLNRFQGERRAVFFVDPPYLSKGAGPGRRLYRFANVNPEIVFQHLAAVNGSFLLCYHDSPDIRKLIRHHGFRFRSVPMRNTHHRDCRELLISQR